MPAPSAIYRDLLRIVYAFVLPTAKKDAFEVAVAALTLVQLMYLVDIALLLQLCDIDLLTGNYRLNFTVAAMGLGLANFLYFYPHRLLLNDAKDIPPPYRTVLAVFLLFPIPLLFVALALRV